MKTKIKTHYAARIYTLGSWFWVDTPGSSFNPISEGWGHALRYRAKRKLKKSLKKGYGKKEYKRLAKEGRLKIIRMTLKFELEEYLRV